jgi:hypothetical protein
MIANTNKDTVIKLPFDQSAGLLLSLLNRTAIREDLRQIFTFPSKETFLDSPYICIHIRRGDVDQARHPLFYVQNQFYTVLIRYLMHSLPREYKVCVCTQGDARWIEEAIADEHDLHSRLFVNTTNQLFANDSEIRDFVIMKNANVLFSASSSFSRWAAFLGHQTLHIDVTRSVHRTLKNTILINPDDSINTSIETIDLHLHSILQCGV